ncbi:histidine kinase OS=Streptomyces cyaneofuscatus OX=66883 GN=G3I52_22205 PE=4 SV=1 [Streptomyces cyaneofuscatus]
MAAGRKTDALHTTENNAGKDMRVYTRKLPPVVSSGQANNQLAVSVARPLSEIDAPLSTLAWVLALVGGIGVVGAGAAGLWVARLACARWTNSRRRWSTWRVRRT